MSARIVTKHLVPGTHNEHVVLEDSLGVRHELTIPLVHAVEATPGAVQYLASDPDAEIAKAVDMMEERERIALRQMRERGYLASSDATGDCGCDTSPEGK